MATDGEHERENLDYFDEETARKIEAGMRLRKRLEVSTVAVEDDYSPPSSPGQRQTD